jgi:hypothetical protein
MKNADLATLPSLRFLFSASFYKIGQIVNQWFTKKPKESTVFRL